MRRDFAYGIGKVLALLCVVFFAVAIQPKVAAASSTLGAWSPVVQWPMIPIHAVLLPDGRVMTYGTQGGAIYDVWDPSAGLSAGHVTLPNNTGNNIFCSAQLVLPGGTGVFIAGGGSEEVPNIESNLFDYGSDTLTLKNAMKRPRWYATPTTLLNGEIYLQGGTGGEDLPEIRDATGNFRLLTGAGTNALNYSYPRNFLAPDGRVFGYEHYGVMYYHGQH